MGLTHTETIQFSVFFSFHFPVQVPHPWVLLPKGGCDLHLEGANIGLNYHLDWQEALVPHHGTSVQLLVTWLPPEQVI